MTNKPLSERFDMKNSYSKTISRLIKEAQEKKTNQTACSYTVPLYMKFIH